MRTLRAWAPLVVVCSTAVIRAATATAPSAPLPATDAESRAAFDSMAGREVVWRREAAKEFPTDHWSQDDDFHRRERDAANDYARSHHVSVGDVLQAVDDGMREHWSRAASFMVPTVPPCQPRAIY
jgi:hypothetical protein